MMLCLRRFSTFWSEPLLKSLSFPIYSFTTGKESGQMLDLKSEVFNVALRPDFIHNAFHYYRMMGKISTKRTLRRADMTASKKKVRPQKGTGRARAGFRFAPRMKGGMKAHGPRPRDFSIKLNKKLVLQALKSTLACKLYEKTMVIVEDYPKDIKKTKEAALALKAFTQKCLLVHSEEFTPNFLLATRRLDFFKKIITKDLNVKALISAPKILITVDGIKELQERIIKNEAKLYMNRKIYRKISEEKKAALRTVIEPVVVKSQVLKEIVQKYSLDIETA